MKKFIATVFLCSTLLVCSFHVSALPFNTSLLGAHFWTERFDDPGFPQYKIHLSVSYNCDGFGAPPVLNISIDTGTGFFAMPVTAVESAFSDQLCPTAQLSNNCTGGAGFAYKEVHYATDWIPYGGNDITFRHDDCCFASSVTNLASPSSAGTRIEGTLSRYTSPLVFASNLGTFRPAFPPFLLLNENELYHLSFGYNISDFDSANLHQRVRYRLVPQIDNNNLPGNYNVPFTFSNPMDASIFELDSVTGILQVLPTASQEAVIAIQTEVIWNDTIVALSFRNQYTLIVGADANEIPRLKGFDGDDDYDTTVLAGVPHVFQIESEDDDLLNSLLADLGNQSFIGTLTLPGISIGPGLQPVFTVSVTPGIDYAGRDMLLRMRVVDDNCPYKASSVHAYTLHVVSSLVNIDSVSVTAACSGGGNLTVHASGIHPPFQYSFNGGITYGAGNQAFFFPAGLHPVIVRDALLNTDTFLVNVPSIPPFSLNIDPQTVCEFDCSGIIELFPNGGTPPFDYAWSHTQDNVNLLTGLCGGTYEVTVSDANACTTSATGEVNELPAVFVDVVGCCTGNLPDTITAHVIGGLPPYTFDWGSGITSDSVQTATVPTFYEVVVTDANGCIGYGEYIAGCADQCVWPGDTDYDGVVDQYDLFPIGIAFGSSGNARDAVSIDWEAHACADWGTVFPFGTEYKHADCNGDGVIAEDDTTAILQNFSATHPLSGAAGGPGAPSLVLFLDKDTAITGDTITAHIALGTSAIPAQNVYAVGFRFMYDAIVVDSNSVQITYTDSWLTDVGGSMNISKKFLSQGRIETALTRIDQTHRSGFGEVAKVKFVVNTSALDMKTLEYVVVLCRVDNVRLIDEVGNLLPVNGSVDTTHIGYQNNTSAIAGNYDDGTLMLIPNPVSDKLMLKHPAAAIKQVEVLNSVGEVVIAHSFIQPLRQQVLNVEALAAGVYFIKARTENGLAVSRFLKQ